MQPVSHLVEIDKTGRNSCQLPFPLNKFLNKDDRLVDRFLDRTRSIQTPLLADLKNFLLNLFEKFVESALIFVTFLDRRGSCPNEAAQKMFLPDNIEKMAGMSGCFNAVRQPIDKWQAADFLEMPPFFQLFREHNLIDGRMAVEDGTKSFVN